MPSTCECAAAGARRADPRQGSRAGELAFRQGSCLQSGRDGLRIGAPERRSKLARRPVGVRAEPTGSLPAPRVVPAMPHHDRSRAPRPFVHGLPRAARGRRAGMTMIEVLVTMTVLGAAFVVYSGAVMSTSRQRSASYETTLAADAAQRILELMRSEEFGAV